MFEEKFSQAVEAILRRSDQNKYNIALGFFNSYVSGETRLINLKLHHKDPNGNEIDATNVPLLLQGTQNTVDDFTLASGDEVIVLFADRAIDKWIGTSSPQTMSNSIKDAKSSAFAIPISSHHTSDGVVTSPLSVDSDVKRRILVKEGKKLQIGTETNELLLILHTIITDLLAGVTVATPDTLTGTGTLTNAANITTELAKLALITKV